MLFCFNFPQQSHVRPRLFLTNQEKREVSFASSSYVQTSSSKFLKVLFQSHGGFHVPWASHHSLLSCVFMPARPYRKQKKTRFNTLTSRLATNLRPLPWSLSGAGTKGRPSAPLPAVLGERGPGWRPPVSGAREVMSKQVIIMRCAFAEADAASPGAPSRTPALPGTPGESSSRTCPSQLQRRRSPMGTRLPTGKGDPTARSRGCCACAGGSSTGRALDPLQLSSRQQNPLLLATVLGPSILMITLDPGDI